jgi:hypothetical protein
MRMRPCPARGAMFVCDTSLAYVGGGFRDMGIRIPNDGIAGEWPDRLWGVIREDLHAHIVRWDPSARTWTPVGRPLRDTPEDPRLRWITISEPRFRATGAGGSDLRPRGRSRASFGRYSA